MKLKFVLSVSCLLGFHFSEGQTCCSGGIPLSNNIGLSNYEKGTLQIGINYDFNNLNTLNSGSERLEDNSRLRITHSILINLGYSITDKLSVEGLFTWVNQRRKITQFDNENLDQTSGIGDGVLLVKYEFQNTLGANSAVSIGLGTKIPLGSSTETNDQGITLNADLQPGSNTWDILYWSSFSKSFNFRPSLNVSSRFIYRNTGTNNSYFGDSTYKFGNEFQFFLGFSEQFLFFNTLASPSLTFKYRNADQDKVNGFDLDNTGGNWVFLIPNFSVDLSPGVSFSTNAEIPLHSYVDGTQLTPTYRITFGLLFKILPRKPLINLN